MDIDDERVARLQHALNECEETNRQLRHSIERERREQRQAFETQNRDFSAFLKEKKAELAKAKQLYRASKSSLELCQRWLADRRADLDDEEKKVKNLQRQLASQRSINQGQRAEIYNLKNQLERRR